ncbi:MULTISPECIES: glycosyltransferase family 4 protein [unclassified Coleofasciculus]|uniref:glycosyltransferase family 4 protein n=1 Tax=unclassified Coleofasciculus TaxID=2692782 RepID=UPI001881AF11|nr:MULTISPECIES: glycosyltransferase family 4 protein [unclassified Coleofasciculus]MBE9129027.1 glycosyltransferase family 4 protein [Coleofasciculus sp. LEGE 07081]MBE9147466.1 glycosyltransferase family 4 protein [Coleofasciculus sp. LEGE 07092]
MKIAYLTIYDVWNKATWPKTQPGLCQAGYYIAKTLAAQSVSMDYIGPLSKKESLLTPAKWNLYHHFFKKDYYRWAEPLIVKDYAYQASRKLSEFESSLVLCPENVVPIAYLKCKQPLVLWTDSTLGALINFYPYLSNLCKETTKNIEKMERAALKNCNLAIYTSDWAAQTAIQLYDIDASKVKVIPWGANLECNRTIDDIQKIIETRDGNLCKLLFLGVDWIRKGGSIAFEVTKKLNKIGLNTELIVIGCKPIIKAPIPDFVRVLGFIDTSTNAGLNRIEQLFAESHFLILPTMADCTPHVLAEANSFGVPCLATKVGGISTLIKDDFNGKTFPPNASISDYCTYIVYLMNNYRVYKHLALSSFEQYQSHLSWSVAIQKLKQLMSELVES